MSHQKLAHIFGLFPAQAVISLLEATTHDDEFSYCYIGTMKEIDGGLHACACADVEPVWRVFLKLGAEANVWAEHNDEVEYSRLARGCLAGCGGVLLHAGGWFGRNRSRAVG